MVFAYLLKKANSLARRIELFDNFTTRKKLINWACLRKWDSVLNLQQIVLDAKGGEMQFKVNGQSIEVEAEEYAPLLWVLREVLKLNGTKFGCGIGQCGACTVNIDGVAMRSCVLPLSFVEGKCVTTIEGLESEGKLHPLQEAWLKENVPQCGYCQSGQIMTACALLRSNSSPTDEQIRTAMEGNLCRCGTYPRIKKAIKRVIRESQETLISAKVEVG